MEEKMNSYIERNTLLNDIRIAKMLAFGIIETKLIEDIIEQQPTADVIPIEWIKEQKDKCFPYSTTALVLNGLITEWERREDD